MIAARSLLFKIHKVSFQVTDASLLPLGMNQEDGECKSKF